MLEVLFALDEVRRHFDRTFAPVAKTQPRDRFTGPGRKTPSAEARATPVAAERHAPRRRLARLQHVLARQS